MTSFEKMTSGWSPEQLEKYLFQINHALNFRDKKTGEMPCPWMRPVWERGKAVAEKYLEQKKQIT